MIHRDTRECTDQHAASSQWCQDNAQRTLLNAGVCGADWDTMLIFIDTLLDYREQGLVQGLEDQMGDMGHYNRAAYDMPKLDYGPHIVTPYKEYRRTDEARWMHK